MVLVKNDFSPIPSRIRIGPGEKKGVAYESEKNFVAYGFV